MNRSAYSYSEHLLWPQGLWKLVNKLQYYFLLSCMYTRLHFIPTPLKYFVHLTYLYMYPIAREYSTRRYTYVGIGALVASRERIKGIYSEYIYQCTCNTYIYCKPRLNWNVCTILDLQKKIINNWLLQTKEKYENWIKDETTYSLNFWASNMYTLQVVCTSVLYAKKKVYCIYYGVVFR